MGQKVKLSTSRYRFRIKELAPGLYEVTTQFENRWEIILWADGTLEIIDPAYISPQNKHRVLNSIRNYIQNHC